MRFTLLDRIIAVQPGERIEAIKSLSCAEEYLTDHFPLFPIMPGVLMLEAMTQAAAWLIRATEDFADSLVTLCEAQHVGYAAYVRPGHTLHVSAEWVKTEGRETTFKTKGLVDGRMSVKAKLVLTRANLADSNPGHANRDVAVRHKLRELYAVLYVPEDPAVAVAEPVAVAAHGSTAAVAATSVS